MSEHVKTERPWAEHLAWCKQRALEYLDQGYVLNAVASMGSDLSQHSHGRTVGTTLLMIGIACVQNHDEDGARRWIEGFR